MPFRDRRDAGRQLAARLAHLGDRDLVVVALPRGGVPVGYEVAEALGAPLDVIIVRKLGLPFQPELGMGAIGEDGVRVLNVDVVRMSDVSEDELASVEARERAELERRALRYRGGRPRVDLEGRTVVIVDDGIATGGTALAAVQVARAHGADRVVLAVPVAPPDTVRRLEAEADEVVCVQMPRSMWAIGAWYEDFRQTSDEEVVELLESAARRTRGSGARRGADPPDASTTGNPGDPPWPVEEDVEIPADDRILPGRLSLPDGATSLVLFAHGSGSSRFSPRNRFVAERLNRAGAGTLLLDLLSPEEESFRPNVFDVDLLARRLVAAAGWAHKESEAAGLPIGYFGASTGAAAALVAAAVEPELAGAVVSRGGRPDLAAGSLPEVQAPTLLIVGGDDFGVIELNRDAAARLRCVHEVELIPGATHLFPEPGALERVADLAAGWFMRWLGRETGG